MHDLSNDYVAISSNNPKINRLGNHLSKHGSEAKVELVQQGPVLRHVEAGHVEALADARLMRKTISFKL